MQFKGLEGKHSVDSDEVAHYEPPHHDLHCFKINPIESERPKLYTILAFLTQ